jgi:hypothetical protein
MATRLLGTDTANPNLPLLVCAGNATTVAGARNDLAVTPASLAAALPVVDVRRFGAKGDGTTDDSPAIQAAIDYCVGGTVADGATTGRIAVGQLYFPPGIYRTTAAPKVVSVLGFHMFGASEYASTIKVSGARTYGIELDGLTGCHIHDLHINGTYGTGSTDTVRDAIALNWTAAASRSTSNVTFERIWINELKFTNGITIGLDTANRQCDNVWVYSCLINGQWTVGEATWWQVGFQSGNGVEGNVLNHTYQSCASAICRYNLYAQSVNVAWQGGDMGSGEIDFRHAGSSFLAVNGVRSEGSQRFYSGNGGASFAASASITNIQYMSNAIAADNRFIRLQYSGSYFLSNINVNAVAANPRIYVQSSAPMPIYVTAIGLQSRTAIQSLFETTATAPTMITSIGYCQLDASGQPLATNSSTLWVKGYNTTSESNFENVNIATTARVGDYSVAANDATLMLDAPTGKTNTFKYRRGGADTWYLYDAGSPILFLRDMANGVMALSINPGAGVTGSVGFGGGITVPGALAHTGTTAGFYNHAAVARGTVPAAATDAATTQALANALRTALVNLGLVT